MSLPSPLHTLSTVFGYDSFRGHQGAIIDDVIAGCDVLVLMPTGGGKSLCYQIPALVREGVGIVISPLIALMQDQVDALHQLGVRAAYLNSALSQEQSRLTEQALLAGDLDLLYIAPERLSNPRMQALLARCRIALFAIDEAHCVSQWGHDFRADYLQLSVLHQLFPTVPRIALTATADVRTREEIIYRLALEQAKVYVSGFDRPNIRYRIVQKDNPRQQLLAFLRNEHGGDSGIVYCLSRRKVEETAAWLNEKGFRARPYHAGMSNDERRVNQHRFLMEDGLIMVATIAFGMGIDKPNVRFVAHLDLPKSIEAYYQETGRAGRDGLPADAWMAYGLQDVLTLRQILSASGADDAHKRVELHKLDAMLALCEIVSCRRQALLAYFGDGDKLAQPCGNCDTCLEPVETWDGSVAAQQALSCIYRTGQRFGVNYLIDVLRGKPDERVRQFGHDRQSTFGIGKGLDEKQWRSVFRQLVAKSLVAIDFEAHGALKLTDTCRPVLRGEQTLMLRKDVQGVKLKANRPDGRQAVRDADTALWNALRTKRRTLAEAQDVPPYVIFHDATLMAMVEQRPRNHQQLAMIAGIGQRKLDLYGDDFLAVLAQFDDRHGEAGHADDTVSQTLACFQLGFSVEQVADRRGLAVDTIYTHLAKGLEAGMVRFEDVIDLPAPELATIESALLAMPGSQRNALKPLYQQFDGVYGYGVLRCVRAALRYRTA
ncbi:MAG: DNA helicase RecQ [Methylomonas sp.]|nr:DNA helicase RecQ [Methylomonas sp.]PPD21200.1 MAG: DNA helicase RecQ [Methylomonas sp.]PPD27693.1 MAG: DNA helicase RecQ [Methylomonas sp.]PPD38887.1 MAG: DNA helicase RecQ [Methylomonas sp.]PPD39678.1 MAG: DNA helicase RecQ [Methylomonas sp.]